MKNKLDSKRRKRFQLELEKHEKVIKASLERDADDIKELQSDWQERDSPAERSLRDVEWTQYSSLNDELSEIAEARERLNDGTYGFCEDCGESIPERRLIVLPTASKCIECQEKTERERGELSHTTL